ncbi:MAG: hypothetical protein PVI43_01235 [Candidatus Bathyarchaeota archaeon]
MNELIPNNHEMEVFNQMAKAAAKSPLYKRWGGFEGILMILLTARELGLPPMLSLNGGINNVQGKIELSARSMNAIIRRAGHQVHTVTTGDTVCTLKGIRADTKEEMEVSFFIEEAKRMGLIRQGSAWEKTPIDMLYARALSRLARRLFPDVIGTCYVEGEIPREGDNNAPVVDVKIKQEVHEKITPDQIGFINDNYDASGIDAICNYFKVAHIGELNQAAFESIKTKVEKKENENGNRD